MNPIAQQLNEASVVLEGTPHPELVAMLRIGAEEIQRLQGLLNDGINSVWVNRRFYFKTLAMSPNTALACAFNSILDALGETREQRDANWKRFYPQIDGQPESASSAGQKP